MSVRFPRALLGALALVAAVPAMADNTAQTLPFSQNWTNTGLITVDDNWSGVPGIEGFLGQNITTGTGTDPRTLLGTSAVGNDLSVLANQTNTNITNGDTIEFEIANPVVALSGSGTADAPYLLLHLNTVGQSNIQLTYNLRDLDTSADDAIQQSVAQYRIGSTGNFTNIAGTYVADATQGGAGTLVTAVSAMLPVDAENAPLVQVRIMTTNAVGNDETLGIDDITIGPAVTLPNLSINDVTLAEGNAGNTVFAFTVSLSAPAGAGGVTLDITTADGTATTADNDYLLNSQNGATIPSGSSSATFNVIVNGDTTFESNETFFVNITNVTGATVTDGQGLGTINNDDLAAVPVVTIANANVLEGDSGTALMNFTVSADTAPASDITFTVNTADGTATDANNDYEPIVAGTGTILAGQTSGTVSVTINGDPTPETDEEFTVTLSALSANATFAGGNPTATAMGLIGNDDTSLTVNSPAAITEGDSGTAPLNFTVSLNHPLPLDLTFTATTSDGSANHNADFVPISAQPFIIPAGSLSVQVPVSVVGDIAQEPASETFDLNIATADPFIDVVVTPGQGTILDNDTAPIGIGAIQGNGLRSPFAPASGNGNGQTVTTANVVVTARAPTGFFVQSVTGDADPLSSEGIMVFTSTAPAASIEVGDIVQVKGAVQEFFNYTELVNPVIVEVSAGNPLPAPVELDQNRPSSNPDTPSCSATLGQWECIESMRVHVAAGAVVAGNLFFASDPFAEVHVTASGERPRREEGVRFGLTPAQPTIPIWDGNPEIFELDADKLLPAFANRAITGGSLFEATGVIGYDFGNHELWPTLLTLVDEPVPHPVPVVGPTQMTIGSFNVLRLCETANCADGTAPTPEQIATKIERIADYIHTVMRDPDVIGVQEVESIALLQALATELNGITAGAAYTAHLAEGNDPGGIDVGYLVRSSRVTVTRVRQLAKDETITDCSSTPPCAKHDRPPLLLQGVYTANGADFPFAVVNNHIRSRSGLDTGAETARVRAKRMAQAQGIANIVQRFQLGQELDPANPIGDVGTANTPLFLVGDYNDFEVTDGWVHVIGVIAGTYDNTKNELQLPAQIVVPALTQGSASIPLDERYSYAFQENLGNILAQEPRNVQSVQILDHGLYNHMAAPWFKGMAYGRTNVDAPRALTTTGTNGIGISDHDGLVMFVETGEEIFANGFE